MTVSSDDAAASDSVRWMLAGSVLIRWIMVNTARTRAVATMVLMRTCSEEASGDDANDDGGG